MKTSTKAAVALAAGAAITLAGPLAANAHVSVDPTSTGAGSYTVLTFAIPHGCGHSATTAIDITIPEPITSVTPTVNPGWAVDTAHRGDRVATVTYTAHTPLPSELRDTFELSLRLPDGDAGDTLRFPVLQTCVEGTENWASDDPADSHPAPFVVLTEGSDASGHDHGTTDDTPAHEPGDDHAGEDASDTGSAPAAPAATSVDTLARVFGIGGLALGAIGVSVALMRGRPSAASVASEKESNR